MPLKTKRNKKIKKSNTKKRIFRRKKTKRKNSKKRKSRRMRGGTDIELTDEQKSHLLEATTDDEFFNVAIDHFGYTKPTISAPVRKNSVIKMLKKLKNKVEELTQLQRELEKLNSMASVEGIITKPPGQFSPEFNTIAGKLVNLSEKEDELAKVQSALNSKVEELAAARSDLTAKEGQLTQLQKELEKLYSMASNEGIITKPDDDGSDKFNTIAGKLVNLSKKKDELAKVQSALNSKVDELTKVQEEHVRALTEMQREHKDALEMKRTQIRENASEAAEKLLKKDAWRGTCIEGRGNIGRMSAKQCFINGYIQGDPTV